MAVEQLRRKSLEAGLSIQADVGDVARLKKIDGQYSAIVMVTVLDHLNTSEIRNVENVLRTSLGPGTQIYVEAFTEDDPDFRRSSGASETSPPVVHYFRKGELRELFKSWEILLYREFRELDSSHGKPHWHGLVIMMARRPE